MNGLDQQQIHFTAPLRGHRIAYAVSGSGYPLLRAPHWLTHLEADWQTPAWSPLLTDLSSRYRLVRFDLSGTGLSDPSADPITLDSLVDELAAVADAAGLQRFALLGMSQGAAVSVRYAARYPHRVSHLILCGGYARGALVQRPDAATQQTIDALCQLVRAGWGIENSAFRQIFTTQFFPDATREQLDGFNRLERLSASPERAAQMIRAFANIDARHDMKAVRCPTVVFHTRKDARVDFEEGRFLAAGIPGARLVPLDGQNHLPLQGQPAYARLLGEVQRLLPSHVAAPAAAADDRVARLKPADRELLDLLAQGLDNAQIAARLGRAEKTVRNRLSALYETLQVESRANAIVLAHRQRGPG